MEIETYNKYNQFIDYLSKNDDSVLRIFILNIIHFIR